jgi:hypothetical protein
VAFELSSMYDDRFTRIPAPEKATTAEAAVT